ncbi:MAG: DUF1015 family protein [bacterium]|nr:DUF1015 family protein [bacterium]MDD6833440.1 DUF1015 family protein [bacterium]MDY4184930.1 DUF1015 family protein [Sodaliphilus sp.]
MAKVKPFRGLRPPKAFVEQVASKPYDVLSSEEARAEAEGNEKSLYHIIKPEIDFEPGTGEHEQKVYDRAVENFQKFQREGWLVKDEKEQYYLYAQTMDGRTQYGLVVGASVDDYLTGKIKKHELTRKEKEVDRMHHIEINNANIEPVFLSFPTNEVLEQVIADTAQTAPEYDFVSEDGIGHTLWCIADDKVVNTITDAFGKIPYLYIADGHHRTAAAAHVGEAKAKADANHTGAEEYNYLLAVCFPESHLKVMDYNRVVKDLNGLSDEEFLQKVALHFEIEEKGEEIYKPAKLHNFALYLSGKWYSLTAKEGTYDDTDPIGVLDVKISSDYILRDILNIQDLRTDKRIDFVGGIRGLGELKNRVDSGEMRMALALYPVTMRQIIDIADSGNIMPPKATWFEPKLRSGLIIHQLD